MDRGDWQVIVHGVAKELDMTQWLNNNSVVDLQGCTVWLPWVRILPLLLTSCRTLARHFTSLTWSSAVRWNHEAHSATWGRHQRETHTCLARACHGKHS